MKEKQEFQSNFADRSRPFASWSTRIINLRMQKLVDSIHTASNANPIMDQLRVMQDELDWREGRKIIRSN